MRLIGSTVAVVMLLAGCSSGEPSSPDAIPPPSASDSDAPAPTPSPSESPSESPSPSAEPEPAEPPPNPQSLPAYFERDYTGGNLRLREIRREATYTEFYATYRTGGKTISGQLLRPNGPGPFPALVYAHGYIDPAVYVNGQGLTREQDYMAARGYVVLHVDYRGHADSSPAGEVEQALRLGYAEDVIGAVLALKKQAYVDADRVGYLGRSMGGGVVYNALVAQPGLVNAAVVFGSVSSLARENFDQFVGADPGRSATADRLLRALGRPAERPQRWRELSARTYFDRVTEPVLIHHGRFDDTCPPPWARASAAALRDSGVDVELAWWDDGHAFGPAYDAAMERTVRFLDRHLT